MTDQADKLVRAVLGSGCELVDFRRPWTGVRSVVARLPEDKEPLLARQCLLGDEELRRAGRFGFDSDRTRFIVRHVLLRLWLAAELEAAPETIRLEATAEGKPFLALDEHRSEIYDFSISGSGECLALALSRGGRIGVDIEQIRDLPDTALMLEAIVTPAESAMLGKLAGPERELAFFQLWVAKEARLKALGTGFLLEPRGVCFDIEAEGGAVRIGAEPQSGWRLCADVLRGGLCLCVAESPD